MPLLADNAIERRLLAAAVALIVLLASTGLAFLSHTLLGWMTPVGLFAPLDLLAVALSMFVGGWIARRGFRGWAVVLVVLAGITSAVAAYGYAPPAMQGTAHWLLRNTALQLALSAAVAWMAASAGERVAARRLLSARA
ncbi:hypothetical protein [Cognatilysobacter lacus]|uniref:Uncharacterized protein n=1 Tax=Cognatilysobacter lacus TaxID=1643323 RepID=A0A5D8Z5D9_9GAMM|nr:hypothetical protein [Lysobacter lacus]TZF89959.1 hypothetical protein FW784_07230 [Lysobacter lacus]